MRSSFLVVAAGLVVTLQVAGADPARLVYAIQRHGNAQSAAVCEPGAADTAHAVALEHTLGSWSRFNWPSFAPTAGLAEVVFQIRADAEEPAGALCRVLADDGIEWQSQPIALTRAWQEVRLGAAAFTCFRGATPETAGSLDLGHAIQFQIVPTSRGQQGTGRFLVDEIRFLPGGPAWTAEGPDLRPPRDAVALEHERLQDLLGRWLAEIGRLGAETDRTSRWATEVERLMADWRERTRRQSVLHQLGSGRCAWNESVPVCRGPTVRTALSLEDYRRQVQDLDTAPVALLDLSRPPVLSVGRLYSAPAQDDPTIVTVDGKPTLRHRIRFAADPARQTVFTNIALPVPANLDGQRVIARLRLTPATLNESVPFLLRLFTDGGGGESWSDLRPQPAPGAEWQDVVFDVANPMRQAHGNPAATLSLALRFENAPGTAAELTLEMTDVRLAPPEPAAAFRRKVLSAADGRLAEARHRLAEQRDRVAALEDRLRELPDLRRLYLASFEPRGTAAARPADEAAVADPLAGLALPARPMDPQRFLAATINVNGQPTVRVQTPGLTPEAEILAALVSADGRLVGAARGQAPDLSLPAVGATPWAPGLPFLYRLRLAAVQDGRLLAWDERAIGLRTCSVTPGGPTALLRHVTQRRQPDWTFRLNGRCWFPRLAVYHWPEPERTEADGLRLFDDLWLDGTRTYGFAVGGASWERCDRLGLAMLTGLAPAYRSLQGWDDMAGWRDEYARACRMARSNADRPMQIVAQVGNEVELTTWGADLGAAFPDALYHPLDVAADLLRREWQPGVPVMYVRAGSFRAVPPLPHEQICGVNQYTGRYSGRSDEIERDLAELARYALWADRPLMITEWMGPQYSWATGGIGGVSPRGAGWYLERYWRAMIRTPGLVGSSQFTLNWVIAPFEDLTNQTREEAWKNRPPHDSFGGGHTADHVPRVAPGKAEREAPSFRAMQAFHSPLYIMAESPAAIVVWGAGAERLAEALMAGGVVARTGAAGAAPDPARTDSHLVLLPPPDASANLPQGLAEPAFETTLNPFDPDLLITTLRAPDEASRERGLKRLLDAASALAELRAAEGAMSRALVVTDPAWTRLYSQYLLEFAGRGYLLGGDEVRTTLNAAEFADAQGQRRPAWQDLSAVILDRSQPLEASDVELVTRLCREGANLIISATTYAASPLLRPLIDAKLTEAGTLADHVSPANAARVPLPVHDLGGADLERIRRFRPDVAEVQALKLYALAAADNAEPFALNATGAAVILHRPLDQGHVFLVGAHIGAAVDVHWRVTHAGLTHPLYDRDTACGLERLSRVVVNLARFDCADQRLRPRLRLSLTPERTLVAGSEALQATVVLTDAAGKPVAGQVRARVRVGHGGRPGAAGDYVDLVPAGPGRFAVRCALAAAGTAVPAPGELVGTLPAQPEPPIIASLQFKAYAPGFVPADGALAYVVEKP